MQTVTILWRYSGSPSASGEDFIDEADISAYANAAVDWSRANGVVSGNPDGSFNPRVISPGHRSLRSCISI